MSSAVRNKTAGGLSISTVDDGKICRLPELNNVTLRKLELSSRSTRSTAMQSYIRQSPTGGTGKLFAKNKESLEDTLIRKLKEKYLPKDQFDLETESQVEKTAARLNLKSAFAASRNGRNSPD